MGKFIDLTGQVFGRWTVLEKAENRGYVSYWKCRCECGKEAEVRGTQLTRGISKSCGCLQKETRARMNTERYSKNSLVGQRFGKLTVLEKVGNARNKEYLWKCQCDCGNTLNVTSYHLRSGHTQSCGCYITEKVEKPIEIGTVFGRLEVIEKTDKIYYKSRVYKCRCECGNIIEVSSNSLRTGHTQSCGCLQSKGEMKISKILRENNIPFEPQKTFDDCRNHKTGMMCFFDFYVNDEYVIEYDGIQHFKATNHGWNTEEHLQSVQERDEYKNEYCKQHNIPIIRIPYTKYKTLTLDDLLLERSS